MGAVFMSCRACWRFQKEVEYRLFVYCLLILVKRQWSRRTTLIYRNDPPTLNCWLAQKTSPTNSTIVRWINHLFRQSAHCWKSHYIKLHCDKLSGRHNARWGSQRIGFHSPRPENWWNKLKWGSSMECEIYWINSRLVETSNGTPAMKRSIEAGRKQIKLGAGGKSIVIWLG